MLLYQESHAAVHSFLRRERPLILPAGQFREPPTHFNVNSLTVVYHCLIIYRLSLRVMGLCASSPKEESSGQQDATHDNKLANSNLPPAAAATVSASAPAKPNVKRPSAQPQSPIDAALDKARKEILKNKGVHFESMYTTSKLIGHGAFAKVSICEHNQTKAQYAAKIVTKSADDPDKQREGAWMGKTWGEEQLHDTAGLTAAWAPWGRHASF